MSMDNNSLIEYIFNNENLDFDIDVENQKVTVKDNNEVNRSLFNETSELKKQIFGMFIKGEDLALKRIKAKLLESKELLHEVRDIGFTVNVTNKGFQDTIEPKDVRKFSDLKIYYIDELQTLIDNFSFETAHIHNTKATYKTVCTV